MKKPILTAIILNLILLLVYFTTGFIQFLLDKFVSKIYISNFIFIFLAILLLIYFINHVSYTKQKIYLIIISAFILTFMLLRAFKYISFGQEFEVVSRYLWYLYYLPILAVPTFLLITSLSNYFRNHKKVVLSIDLIAGSISLILLVIILLNDVHQKAFIFNENFLKWDSDYKYGLIYYLLMGYVVVLFTASFVIFIRQCKLSKGRKLAYISLVPFVLGIAWIIFDIFDLHIKIGGYKIVCEFPETFCFMVVGYIFNLIHLHLISSNKEYGKIFQEMSLPAVIRDKSNQVIYKNSDIEDIKDDQLVIKNNLYRNISISGGRITWVSDVSDINVIYQKLNEINERLKEEEQLNKLKNNLKAESLIVSEKNNLYDEIAKDVVNESNRIMKLSKDIKKDPSLYDKEMPVILLLSIYIKRIANLKLLSKEKEEMDVQELYLSINETLRYLEKLDIKTSLIGNKEGTYNSEQLFNAYSFFGNTLINNLDLIKGVTVFFNSDNLKINIESSKLKLDEKLLEHLNYVINKEDDTFYITLKGDKVL